MIKRLREPPKNTKHTAEYCLWRNRSREKQEREVRTLCFGEQRPSIFPFFPSRNEHTSRYLDIHRLGLNHLNLSCYRFSISRLFANNVRFMRDLSLSLSPSVRNVQRKMSETFKVTDIARVRSTGSYELDFFISFFTTFPGEIFHRFDPSFLSPRHSARYIPFQEKHNCFRDRAAGYSRPRQLIDFLFFRF